MKQLGGIVIALCSLTSACTRKDTEGADLWRAVEPRMTFASRWQPCRKMPRNGHLVDDAACSATKTPSPVDCDNIVTHDEAVRVLAYQPLCTDAAISALERFSRRSPAAMSDLAGAYYVRAQREDRPSDLLHAWEAADRAVAAAPRLSAALFNRALISEALGLPTSWDAAIAADRSPWSSEARQHREQLERARARDAATQWARNSAALPAALSAGNRNAVAQLIAPFPSAAQRYLEEVLLSEWAASPTEQRLAEAKLLAEEISRVSHDRYALDVVEAIAKAPRELRQAHLMFAEARTAAQKYAKAATLFQRYGSPFALEARRQSAIELSTAKKFERAARELEPFENEARKRGYQHKLAQLISTRAFFLLYQGHFMESLDADNDALAIYTALGDDENIADVQMRRISPIRGLGDIEAAWSEAARARRSASQLIELRSRHALLGDVAATALQLGHPQVALAYQDAAVGLYKNELVSLPPEDTRAIGSVLQNLATALRARAGIELHLGRHTDAVADLDETSRLTKKTRDTEERRILEARAAEVRGQVFLRSSNFARAASEFTTALVSTELSTFRASLYAQRAEANQLLGRKADAEKDLRRAIEVLNSEEKDALARRKPGNDDVWKSYFARFQDTYRRLIRQLIDENPSEAFTIAERGRAFEPLNLVLKPKKIDAINLKDIQRSLPPDTFILEYSVSDDGTIVWIVSRDRFEHLKLPAKRADVERWSGDLLRAARAGNNNQFEAGLDAPYVNLMAQPLSAIKSTPKLLVIVPDGAMHRLPFAALRDPESHTYLIEKCPIAVAGSAKLYYVARDRDRTLSSDRLLSVLLVGDPAFNGDLSLARGLKRLPGAQQEVKDIRGEYGDSSMLLEEQATVSRFFELAPHSAVVHIAAHAIANAREPSHSLILLAPSKNDSGVLDAERLLARRPFNRTKLVVLSACSSSGGLPIGPEGVAPLVRALIAAGVPAVIGSLWDVNDATAQRLLVSFHRHYRQGSDAAIAMQLAQREMLGNTNPGLRPALAWASFQVIGHSSSPFPVPRRK